MSEVGKTGDGENISEIEAPADMSDPDENRNKFVYRLQRNTQMLIDNG